MRTLCSLFGIFFVLFWQVVLSQDLIIKRDSSRINAKIIEVLEDQIKYKLTQEPDGPIFSLKKYEIQRVELAGGSVLDYSSYTEYGTQLTEKDKIFLSKKRSILIDFLGPAFNHVSGGYQWHLKDNLVGEIKAGYVGLVPAHADETGPNYGFFVSPAVKFKTDSDVLRYGLIAVNPLIGITALLLSNKNRQKPIHPLNFAYIKPQLSIGYLNENDYVEIMVPAYPYPYPSYEIRKTESYSAALHFCLGQQVVLADFLLLDYYAGIGYGFYRRTLQSGIGTLYDDTPIYFHSHLIFDTRTVPISLTAGISLGILTR